MAIERRPARGRFNDALRRDVECIIGLRVGAPTVRYESVTGEPYVALTNGGIKVEGKRYPVFSLTRGIAMAAYLTACWDYSQERLCDDPFGTFLYWREYPTIRQHESGTWTVYSRLLVSDKPIVVEAERAA